MDKVIENGHVAVIYNSTYGSEWFEYHRKERPQLIFDSGLVNILKVYNQLADDFDMTQWAYLTAGTYHIAEAKEKAIAEYCKEVYPEFPQSYFSHCRGLDIFWAPLGSLVTAKVYDGKEDLDWNYPIGMLV